MSEETVFLKWWRAVESKFSCPQSFSLFLSCLVLSALELHHSHPDSWSQPHWVISCFLWHRDSLDTYWILTQAQAFRAQKKCTTRSIQAIKRHLSPRQKGPRPLGSCWTDVIFYFMQNSVTESGNFGVILYVHSDVQHPTFLKVRWTEHWRGFSHSFNPVPQHCTLFSWPHTDAIQYALWFFSFII